METGYEAESFKSLEQWELTVLVDLFFFFFVYVTKEVTVQQMLKDHSSQRSLGHFVVTFQNVENTAGCWKDTR